MVNHTPARLGSLSFLINPVAVQWGFDMRVVEHETVGGRVIQVFGTDLGDMVVTGSLGVGDRERGDTEGWEALDRFRRRIEDMAEESAQGNNPVHRFVVPSHKWAFDVYIKSLAPIRQSNETPSPEFTLTLFVVEDITGKVVKGIKDKYMERLVKGIGWSQSEYNGPSEEEVEALLAPYQGSPGLAYKTGMIEAFTNALGAVTDFAGSYTGGPGGITAFMWALREQESNQNYTAVNPSSGASGAYQYIDSTWGGYKGYTKASHAPPQIQDEKAHADISTAYARTQNWRNVAAFWLTGQDNPPNWNVAPGVPGTNPTIEAYVQGVLSKMAQSPVK